MSKAARTLPGGLFITFEGPEGAGKSTQARFLAQGLAERGWRVLLTREPGGTPLGERLRDLLMHHPPEEGLCPESELLLFGASRAQLVRTVIQPELDRGGVVVCDRFADSTTAYQGGARGLSSDFIERMHDFTLGSRWPDLTFLLDLGVDEGLGRHERARGAGRGRDRIEDQPRAFHRAVREHFLALAAAEPERFRLVDAAEEPEPVRRRILEAVDRALS